MACWTCSTVLAWYTASSVLWGLCLPQTYTRACRRQCAGQILLGLDPFSTSATQKVLGGQKSYVEWLVPADQTGVLTRRQAETALPPCSASCCPREPYAAGDYGRRPRGAHMSIGSAKRCSQLYCVSVTIPRTVGYRKRSGMCSLQYWNRSFSRASSFKGFQERDWGMAGGTSRSISENLH